jgi:hypothetical protein
MYAQIKDPKAVFDASFKAFIRARAREVDKDKNTGERGLQWVPDLFPNVPSRTAFITGEYTPTEEVKENNKKRLLAIEQALKLIRGIIKGLGEVLPDEWRNRFMGLLDDGLDDMRRRFA